MVENLANKLRLMLVTDDRLLGSRDPIAVCQAAERGGATAVQLRLKDASARELATIARRLTRALRVPLIVNDRPDVAAAVGSWVHLGPDDVPIAEARKVLREAVVVGASVGSEGEAARSAGADYWGVGPLHGSATKTDAGQALGLGGFRRMVALAHGRPCLAIGGVVPPDVPLVLEAGGAGVAVASGILSAGDVEEATRGYAARFSGPD
jgi:thiamine-phosphate pyrophosphorylase